MSTLNVNRVVDASGGVLSPISSVMRNRIINGAMVIDQRNAGAAVNGNGGNKTFPVDRFYSQVYNTSGNTTGQQSSLAPAGFVNSLRLSCQTADTSVGSTDVVWYGQSIEGFNTADFDFGKSTAKTITLSFWVYSNVTGTYCVALKNSAENRSYVAEYTVLASNTWERKTITIAGDTTGTWLTTNGTGLQIWFVLMAGSSQQTTANTWTATSGVVATSNQVNFLSSTANAMNITGVQLEVGTQATSFEYRQYQQELALCQRYYERQVWSAGSGALAITDGYVPAAANIFANFAFNTTKRSAPTVTKLGTWTVSSVGQPIVYGTDVWGCVMYATASGAANGLFAIATGSGQGFEASAEL